ncbi:MAG TPA: hypothetical protein VF212_17725 [Longimicrobiales bacterium]
MATSPEAVPKPAADSSPTLPLPLGLTPYTLVLIGLLVAAYVFFIRVRPEALRFDPNALANLGSVLAPLVVCAAFIERAVEVVLTPLRGEESARLQAKAQACRATGDHDEAAEHETRLTEHKLGSRRRAFFLAVALGIAASLLGIRGLESLLADGAQPGTGFEFFDIVLTGLVIGGGADGIHKIVKAFTDYMEMVSRKTQSAG